MKRELLDLKQKLMQRFLDGAIDQKTYDRMLTEIEAMAQEEETAPAAASGPVILEMNGAPADVSVGAGAGMASGSAGGAGGPILPSFVTVLPPGAPMQMSAAYPYPPGNFYPGYPMGPNGMPVNGMAGGTAVSFPGGFPAGNFPGGSFAQGQTPNESAHAMISANQLEVRTASGVKPASVWQETDPRSLNAPSPEIDPLVIKALKPGETLEVWWHYELTPECVSAWKKIDVPLRLSLTMNETIDDSALQLLGQIANLHEVNLTSTQVTDEGIRTLGRLVNLESLILTSTEVTGATFGSLENCRNLRELTLTSTPFSNEGMEFLPQFQLLDSLKLDDTNITDEGMPALEGLHQMLLLNLQGTLVSDAGLKRIAHMTSLVELYLGGTIPYEGEDYESPITDKGIESLRELTELRVLHLNDTQVTNACLTSLKKMTGLCELNVTDTYFSDDALKTLHRYENLQEVIVDGTLITDAGIRKVFGRTGTDIFHGAKSGSWSKLGRFIFAPWSRKN